MYYILPKRGSAWSGGDTPAFAMYFDGDDESQSFSAVGKWVPDVTITYGGEVRLDTSQKVSGTSSLEIDWNIDANRGDDYVEVADMPNFTLSDYTIRAYVRIRQPRNYQLTFQVNRSFNYSPCLVVDQTNMRFVPKAGGYADVLVAPAAVDTWYLVEQIVKTGTSRTYLDGNLKGTNASYSSGIAGATLLFDIGYGGPNSDNYPFSGWMDSLEIYDYAIR